MGKSGVTEMVSRRWICVGQEPAITWCSNRLDLRIRGRIVDCLRILRIRITGRLMGSKHRTGRVLSTRSHSASRAECRFQRIWKWCSTSDKGRRRTRFCTPPARLKTRKTNSGKSLPPWTRRIILLIKGKHRSLANTSSSRTTQKPLLASRATPSQAKMSVIRKCRIIWWWGSRARSRRDRSRAHTATKTCIPLLMTIWILGSSRHKDLCTEGIRPSRTCGPFLKYNITRPIDR